jgi:hypothetical protein
MYALIDSVLENTLTDERGEAGIGAKALPL